MEISRIFTVWPVGGSRQCCYFAFPLFIIKSMKRNWGKLVLSVVVCNIAGAIGALFTAPAVGGWYSHLNKPPINPPDWIFAPVWTALYVAMGLSFYIIWIKVGTLRKLRIPAAFFGAQLLLNSLWSVIFFGFKLPLLAFIEILVLWAAIIYTIKIFYSISRAAGNLLVPYILWVSFAAVLNLWIVMLN